MNHTVIEEKWVKIIDAKEYYYPTKDIDPNMLKLIQKELKKKDANEIVQEVFLEEFETLLKCEKQVRKRKNANQLLYLKQLYN